MAHPSGALLRVAAFVVMAAIVSLILASAAWGTHIRGATYKGTHAGGGAVEFKVSSDGRRITRFKATNIQGDVCTVGEVESIFPGTSGPRITLEGFEQRAGGGRSLDFEGSFLAKQRATGGFFYDSGTDPFRTSCLSEIINWTARTNASPAGTVECKSAKRSVRKAKRALRRATSGRARRKAERKLRSARKQQRRYC